MGAEVIRVEPPGGTVDRTWGILGPDGETITFKILGRNKKAITLNLGHKKGQAIFNDLVRCSDVVIHNFPPGTSMADMMIYESLKKINTQIIVAAISGYGLTGPDAEKICFDFVTQARSGAMTLNGFPGEPPIKTTVPYIDCGSGLAAALGISTALFAREKSGVGQLVDVALFDIASFFTQNVGALLYHKIYGVERTQLGNFGFASFMTCLRGKNGRVMVVASSDNIWNRFIEAIGKKVELEEDSRFANDMVRSLNSSAIDEIAQQWAENKNTEEIVDTLERAKVPCSVVNTVGKMLDDPQIKAREMIISCQYDDIGEIPIAGLPIKLSDSQKKTIYPAPKVGEHNEEVYGRVLGISREAIDDLKKEGVI